jgi:hypothetical protein
MKIKQLSTVGEVIEVIGSLELQQLIGKRTNNLTNWRTAGNFPPETYAAMKDELERLGRERRIQYRAPRSLWRQIGSGRAA